MSEIAKQLFEGLKAMKESVVAAAPGLKDLVPEAKAEFSRMGTQGAMELASALFNGSAFVPYGPPASYQCLRNIDRELRRQSPHRRIQSGHAHAYRQTSR
jgi:hypothetical protein